jgi:hypothetical protein
VVPVLMDEFGAIIDGYNRARACRELGINDYPVETRTGLSEEEKRALARKLNALRRHLSREQVRDLIADQLRDTPEWSNRRIAAGLGADHKTVGAVRGGMKGTGEIPQLEATVGRTASNAVRQADVSAKSLAHPTHPRTKIKTNRRRRTTALQNRRRRSVGQTRSGRPLGPPPRSGPSWLTPSTL